MARKQDVTGEAPNMPTMPPMRNSRRVFRAAFLLATFMVAAAQARTAHPAGSASLRQQSPQDQTVFHANTREVILDVTVLDVKGNPVKGLSESAFHITDDSHPQQARSFVEHTTAEPQQALTAKPVNAAAAGTFSNEYVRHPPAAYNVILLDTTTIDTVDQMYLYWQLQKFLDSVPANQLLAVYWRAGLTTLLLQNFTNDHARLLAAVRRAIPRLPHPDRYYASDYGTLAQMATFLAQLPGRKNILWFSGGSRISLLDDPERAAAYEELRAIFDELERDRIAVYPIDVRGLTGASSDQMIDQHMIMNDIAGATGGIPAYNNNWIWQVADHVVDTSSSFYTLTYSPDDLKLDKKWHRVKVTVDGGDYRVAYRQGYYDDGGHPLPKPLGHARTMLRADGTSASGPDIRSEPIIFQLKITPSTETEAVMPGTLSPAARPKKNEREYTLHYTLPIDSFQQQQVNGAPHITVGAGVLAFNSNGRLVAKSAQQAKLDFDPQKIKTAKAFGYDQRINLPKGQGFVFVAVWDGMTGRVGTMEVPVEVAKK